MNKPDTMFELIEVDGKMRFAFREEFTPNDFALALYDAINSRVISAVKEAQRKRIL